jgi:hypothetical protein
MHPCILPASGATNSTVLAAQHAIKTPADTADCNHMRATQVPVSYQPAEELYCVRALYTPLDQTNLSAGLRVANSANRGSVSGPRSGTRCAGCAASQGNLLY